MNQVLLSQLTPAITFRAQGAWCRGMTAGRIVNAKKRKRIDPNTVATDPDRSCIP